MDRVKQYAAKVDGIHYRPRILPVTQERNERIIRDAMRQGREIIDIGPAFERRAYGRGPSPFYNGERRLTVGYEGYTRVFKRTGRVSGGVPGLDF